jgi:uncharacterized protein (TIGR03086 family)
MSDALALWSAVADEFTARLQLVRPHQWLLPTPCAGWYVRALVEHAVFVQRRLPRAVGAGSDIDAPLGEHPKAAWSKVIAVARAVLLAPGTGAAVIRTPLGERSIAEAVDLPLIDLLIHTWDLARSIGADERLNIVAVQFALNTLKPIESILRSPTLFGPAVEPVPDSDAQTQLLCYLGRQP